MCREVVTMILHHKIIVLDALEAIYLVLSCQIKLVNSLHVNATFV